MLGAKKDLSLAEIAVVAHRRGRPPPAWFGLLSVAPAFALALASLAAAVVVSAGPRSKHEVAAVFPPWWTTEQALTAARRAGAVIRIGGAGSIMVVAANDDSLSQRLYAEGALLLLDPVVTGLCGPGKEPGNV